MIDREGIVRWVNIECGSEGLAGIGKLASEEEILGAARACSALILQVGVTRGPTAHHMWTLDRRSPKATAKGSTPNDLEAAALVERLRGGVAFGHGQLDHLDAVPARPPRPAGLHQLPADAALPRCRARHTCRTGSPCGAPSRATRIAARRRRPAFRRRRRRARPGRPAATRRAALCHHDSGSAARSAALEVKASGWRS